MTPPDGIGKGTALSAAALVGIGTIGAVIATAFIALDLWLPTWSAGLIVTGWLTLVACLTALVGGDRVRAAQPAAPQRAILTTRRDIETAPIASAWTGRS